MYYSEKIQYLLENLTVEEKIMLLKNDSPKISSLNIRSYNWWNESLHGVARAGIATVFPQAIGLAATFNTNIMKRVGEIISDEGRSKYNKAVAENDYSIYKGLTFWSPNVNIFRDPRWGRGQETYGEDPFLTGELAVHFIQGIQGENSENLKAAACAKHFAAHSGPEGKRHGFNSKVSKKDLYETYFPAFEKCVKTSKVEAVMTAYNAVNGTPASANEYLLKDVLRGSWGFKGHVVSDCGAICDISNAFLYASTISDAAALAIKAGCDLNCGNAYEHLLAAYHDKLITQQDIDVCLERLLDCRLRLGVLFVDETTPYDHIGKEVNDSAEHKQFNIEVAKESIVLLKNDDFLPLNRNDINTVAVIGPCSDSLEVLLGNYSGTPSEYTTFLDGIRNHVDKNTRVFYSEGCHLFQDNGGDVETGKLAEAVSIAERADVIFLCVGLSPTIEGEAGDAFNSEAGGDKLNLYLPAPQQKLKEQIFGLNKPVVVITTSGSALDLGFANEKAKAILQCFYPGAQGGNALGQLIFGDYSPSGKLPVTFYKGDTVLPDFENYSMENRTYRYFEEEPLYPFGFGLNYTDFEYSNIILNEKEFGLNDMIELSVEVKNTGSFDSNEVIQVYAALKGTENSVAKRNLMAFKKVFLAQSEKKTITISIEAKKFYTVDDEGNYWFEPATCELSVGSSQSDVKSIALMGRKPLCANIAFAGNKTLIAKNI